MMEIKYVERGHKEDLVLIPGWATDFRVFGLLDLPYNYLFPVNFYPFNFAQEFCGALGKGHSKKLSILGWSMGGFLAADFCQQYPGKVNELIMLAVRKKYDRKILREINIKLAKNKNAWLYKFYQDFFAKEEVQGFSWFKRELFRDYAESIASEDLAIGLEYLSHAQLDTDALLGVNKIRIFHGAEDLIAPLAEGEALKSYLPQATFFRLEGAGHACFFNPAFKASFSHE
ncbi:MAG: alpha/beta hydrolase [Candidatus Omnitrophica bacterium]|nr:alpha/beta hydrolase [Candidatus Omnitrophota bacterium]